jgi:CRP-like cAMP-binding protein
VTEQQSTARPADGDGPACAASADPQNDAPRWDEIADCRRCALRKRGLFSVLRGADYDQITSPIRRAAVPAETAIYAEDAVADAVYTIRWGVVKLVKPGPDGRQRIVRLLGKGAAIGLEGIREGVYWHEATALQHTGLCRIPIGVVERLQGQNPQLAQRLIQQWEEYLQQADHWIVELSAGPVQERVRRLIALLVRLSDDRTGEVELPSVADMASILGTSVESVSRATAELKRERVLVRIAPRTYRYDADASGT